MAEMGQFAGELAQKGKMRGGAPLHPENTATRISVRGGRAQSVDGPFAESKEVIGGFFMVDAASRAEAIEIAKRCPAARSGIVQVSEAMAERVPAPPSGGTRYMLLFVEGPELRRRSRRREVPRDGRVDRRAEGREEVRRVRGAREVPPPARIEVRAGKTAVSDGPFAESKEVIGGYAIVDVPDRAEALAVARRCPHAAWGEVEVREVMKVGAS